MADTLTTSLPEVVLDVYSLDIEHEALGVMRFEEFAVKKTELEKEAGDTVKFTKYNQIALGDKLAEGTALEGSEKAMSADQISISIDEYGNAIQQSERLIQTAMDDTLAEAAIQLGRDYSLVTEELNRNSAMLGAATTIFAGDATIREELGDAAATPDRFDVEMIRRAVETLQTNNAPKFNNDFYVCFIHPHQAADIKRDPDWISANEQHQTRGMFNGEIGRWEDVVFISTTHMPNGAGAAGSLGGIATTRDGGGLRVSTNAALYVAGAAGTVTSESLLNGGAHADQFNYDFAVPGTPDSAIVYQAVFAGDNAWGFASGLPVEMRDNGVQDYGRKHGLAWYSIYGAGVINPGHLVLAETL